MIERQYSSVLDAVRELDREMGPFWLEKEWLWAAILERQCDSMRYPDSFRFALDRE